MRKRTNESLRRTIRLQSTEWQALTSETESLAKALDDNSLWHFVYSALPDDEEGEDQARGFSYRRSILWVDDLAEVRRILVEWSAVEKRMQAWQAENEPPRAGRPQAGIPPRFRPPRLFEDIAEVRIYENQASTSWKVGPGEVSSRIDRAMESVEQLLDRDHELYDLRKGRERLEELLVAQADTWMGILVARDYPEVARRHFAGLVPSTVVVSKDGNSHTDEALALFERRPKSEDEDLMLSLRAFERLKHYMYLLGVSEEQAAPKRIRLEHAGRRVFLRHADGSTETVPLVNTGLFIAPAVGIGDVASLLREVPSGDWKRRKPNRNTLFRIGRYEFCVD